MEIKLQLGPLIFRVQTDSEELFSCLREKLGHLSHSSTRRCDHTLLVHCKNCNGHPPLPLCEFMKKHHEQFADSSISEVNIFVDFYDRSNEALWKSDLPRGFLHALRVLIEHWMLSFAGLCFHASTISDEKQSSLLCLGSSGAGKSTISNLAGAAFSDEGSIVIRGKTGWRAAPSPFWSNSTAKAVTHQNTLVGCIFLHHSKQNSLVKKLPTQAITGLLQNMINIERSPKVTSTILTMACQLANELPVYDFYFLPEQSAIDYLWSRFL